MEVEGLTDLLKLMNKLEILDEEKEFDEEERGVYGISSNWGKEESNGRPNKSKELGKSENIRSFRGGLFKKRSFSKRTVDVAALL